MVVIIIYDVVPNLMFVHIIKTQILDIINPFTRVGGNNHFWNNWLLGVVALLCLDYPSKAALQILLPYLG